MSDPSEEDGDLTALGPVEAPRWYNIALVVLALAVAVYLLSLNQPVFAAIFFVAAAIAAGVEFWWQPRVRRRGKARVGSASYGSNSFLGLLYLGLGAISLALGTQMVSGLLMLALGVLTLAAFGPGYLRSRRVG